MATALLASSLSAATPAAKSNISDLGRSITTKTLKNGMKIIVWPDHDIPNVALYNWFHVGSRNEQYGKTGLSHFFEHMMFNGAKKYGPGEFDRVMEANGGQNNAYTSENVTVYQDWFPRSALELIFDLEADRIQNLAFDPKIIDSERGVVYSERRSSVDNDNNGLLNEQVQAAAFIAHPYHTPVIGWPSDIEAWTHEDLTSYFKTYYAPNNATMLVVGDVTAEEIFKLAEKYLEPIPAQPAPPAVRTKEPEQMGERRVTLVRDAQTPLIQMAYHVGTTNDPEGVPLELLLNILTDGDSSRLHKRLVEDEQIAIDVSSFRNTGFDPTLAWIAATVAPGTDAKKVEAVIDEELQKLIKDGVTDIELQKAKNNYVANFYRSMKTISGKAQLLGTYEVFYGDYNKLFNAPSAHEAVTRDQIRAVAAKVFVPTNRTVGVLMPAPADAPQKEPAR
jgi:zinc protease